MSHGAQTTDLLNAAGRPVTPNSSSVWSTRYRTKHRWIRLAEFPTGIQPPRKVRIYRRADHFMLQWWDPAEKRNLADRVNGDLLSALMRARQIDDRIADFRTSAVGKTRRRGHSELVAMFVADLNRRADAGEIDPGTVRRYDAALRHYLAYCEQPLIAKKFPSVTRVDREFRLGLAAFLADRRVGGNGRVHSAPRPMRGQFFILDTVRALFEWAADPDRGNVLSDGFRNPFLRQIGAHPVLKGDPLASPDINLPMALDLVDSCDAFQLRIFVPMLLFGLRAAEPTYLFHEHFDGDWLRVPNIPEMAYQTKGRREKRFPLIDDLAPFWRWWRGDAHYGLLYERRAFAAVPNQATLSGAPLQTIVAEFQRRGGACGARDAASRRRLRQQVLRDAGALFYDELQHEFTIVAKRLNWPSAATLKDLRHFFATSLANAAMPEGYRRYLMGHAPGNAAILAYTHLNELVKHFASAIRQEWSPLVAAINGRVTSLLGVSNRHE